MLDRPPGLRQPSDFLWLLYSARRLVGNRTGEGCGMDVTWSPSIGSERRTAFGRRMVAKHAMRRGEQLTPTTRDFKRPAMGVQLNELPYTITGLLVRNVSPGEELEWADRA